jgi:hypothetical protein
MGAGQSAPSKPKSLSQVIDYVAANFITKQRFQDMVNLSDMKYCNDLVVMTSDIIADTLSDMDIKYLAQRLKEGVEMNEMTSDRVIFLNRNKLDELDISNPTQKRRVCIGIARFYVKVAHLFAAIMTTVNPTYTYTDAQGSRQNVSLMNRGEIPEGAKASLRRINICSQRINALLNNNDYDVAKDVTVSVGPSFCNLNFDPRTRTDRNLSQEPGIPELEKLYYDEYNYDQGGFVGMTEETRKNVYEKDVETFYRAFTGNKDIPKDSSGQKKVKKFADISLRDFHKSKGCAPGGLYTKTYTGTLSDQLFANYAAHVKKMMQDAATNQDKLLGIVDKLFVYSVNPKTKSREIVINPALTEKDLQKLVEEARGIIVNLYIKCEDDFVKGLQLFEAIIEHRIKETGDSQVRQLEESMQNLIAEPPSTATGGEAESEVGAESAAIDVSNVEKDVEVEEKSVEKAAESVDEAKKEGTSAEAAPLPVAEPVAAVAAPAMPVASAEAAPAPARSTFAVPPNPRGFAALARSGE